MTTSQRTYRATYHPKDRDGYPTDNPSGVLPSIRVTAADAESAHRIAFAETGCPIANVERLDDDATPELTTNSASALVDVGRLRPVLAGLAMGLAMVANNVGAEPVFCAKDTKPGDCFVMQPIPGAHDGAAPSAPAASPTPSQTATATPATAGPSATNTINNAATVGGDTVRSTVAVFPAPSAAPLPVAQSCIVTRSVTAGIGWNLLQGARAEQYSDPVCVVQQLAATATDPAEAARLRALVLKMLGVQ